jgi:2-oxoglutarate-Fe(II)-dependent oxygenase superfamily protein
MRCTMSTPHFAVFDDFLEASELRKLWRELRREEYVFINKDVWERVYGLFDGRPLMGPGVIAGEGVSDEQRYPTGRAVDLVIRAILRRRRTLEPWVGRRGSDWSTLTATPFLYPQESGLGWHDDTAQRTGAFTLYVHPTWDPGWGGELLIGSDHTSRRRPQARSAAVFTERAAAIDAMSLGTFVVPVPNRMVIVKGGVPHRINTVDRSAGAHLRTSVAGFFVSG